MKSFVYFVVWRRLVNHRLIFALVLIATTTAEVANADDWVSEAWRKTIQQAALVKDGLERFHNPQYEYECLGLGGTVMRVGPDGFTKPGAVAVPTNGWLTHLPYLSYQYWWDEEAHRHLPFDLSGGYGPNLQSRQVKNFRHHLDIATGLLTIDLGLKADFGETNLHKSETHFFQSHREMFVTPEGVLVIRVNDSTNAPLPFQLRVDVNQNVRIYLNGGVYAKENAPWNGAGAAKNDGLVVVANRPKSCVATLAIACESADLFLDPQTLKLGSTKPGKTVTFYIAPGSSYESADPAATAWQKAESAKARGFESLRVETAQWWKEFYAQSAVDLPDRELAKWFARSTYYMGVFFGNTDVPPGCNGSSIESFAGAICPEYDLVLNQMALLYGNHFEEARRVVGWLGRALPRAERYAKEGLTLHKISTKYKAGAKFGPLMGYDGTILVPPTEGEGVWAHEDFSGNNAALMALNYVDWSGDSRHDELARRILKETTQVSVEDLQWRPELNAYLNKNMSATVQQAGTLFGLRASVRRAVAEPEWNEMISKVLLPTADYKGKKVLTVGPGAIPVENSGDATWLSPVWYYLVVSAHAPLVSNSYALFRTSATGKYVFNNGWMGVMAAKLGKGEEAVRWARSFLQPGVTLFDDSCFGELVSDAEDFKKTPEVAAHAALICNLTQMLLDPDDEEAITIFPAIPAEWVHQGIAFEKLAAMGNILVSAEFKTNRVCVTLENRSANDCARSLRLRLPKGTTSLQYPGKNMQMKDGWVALPAVMLPAKRKVTLTFGL